MWAERTLHVFNWLWCRITNHVLIKVRPLAIGGELYQCLACKAEFAIHHGRQCCLPFDDEFRREEEEFAKMLNDIRRRRDVS